MNIEAIRKMKHAIGFDIRKAKSGKLEAYRNFYDTGKRSDPDWEEMVAKGYATCDIRECGVFEGYHFYHVTEEGIKMLSEITGIKIVLQR